MKKILIFHREDLLKPVGGPSGYLNSLKQGLDLNKEKKYEISFLPESSHLSRIKEKSKTSKNILVKKMLNVYRQLKHIKQTLDIMRVDAVAPIDISKFDAIHFHATRSIYCLRKQLENYSGKVILTSHSPQPLSSEIIESSSKLELLIFGKKYKKLIEMDKYAFERADYIVFPCENADEPYEHNWDEYSTIKKNKGDSYRYFLTGTIPAKISTDRESVRKKYNIPEDAFVISYVGRHNEIKGYGRLKEIGKEILNRHPNVYVLVAGNIGPIFPPDNERWIEVGWTNEPHSYVAASDLFVLPNKETYFDMVLLEVLSIGIPVVISNTGGNKYFDALNMHGIKLFDSNEHCIGMIESFIEMSNEKTKEIQKENRELFDEKFTIEKFASGYLNVLDSIFEDEYV